MDLELENKNYFINPLTADQLEIGTFQYQLNPEERFISTNRSLAKIFGYPSPKDLETKHFDELFMNLKDRKEFLTTLKRSGKVKFFETSCPNRRGRIVWIAISACLIINGDKEQYIEGIVQNISSYKETNERLAEEINLLQGFLDSMPDAIYFKDRRNRITRVNKFYANGFKMKSEQIIGKTDFDFFPEEHARQMYEDDNYILKTGKPIIGKIERTLLPNKTWNQVITTKVPMYDRGGKIIGTMGITRDMTAHANLERERFSMILNALAVLGKALEMRDPYTYCHTRFVAAIAQAIGKALKFNADHLMQIKLAAELHDLGKISIPLDILIKPGRLSDLEFQLVQKHVDNCYSLIKDIEFPFPLAEIVYQHHERLDGSGYPRRLKGDEILLEARILAVSDVLEAMTSHRPYREALGLVKAVEELEKFSGIRYDSKIVKIALKLIKKNDGRPFWQDNNLLSRIF